MTACTSRSKAPSSNDAAGPSATTRPCDRPMDAIGIGARIRNLVQAAQDRDAVGRGRYRAADPARPRLRSIETGNRLVGDDQVRLLRQRACDRDTLLLAPRQRVGALRRLCQQPDPLQTLQRQQFVGTAETARPTAPCGHVAQPSRQDVVERRQAPDEIILLEHDGDAPARASLQAADRIPSDQHVAAIGRQQPVRQRNKVVLAEPLGPSSATNSRGCTVKLTSRNATRSPNDLPMPVAVSRGCSLMRAPGAGEASPTVGRASSPPPGSPR